MQEVCRETGPGAVRTSRGGISDKVLATAVHMQSCFRACALRLHTGAHRESVVSVGMPSLSPAGRVQQSSWVLAADLSSGRWQGMDFGEETRPGLDPKHNWETPRSNCTTSWGAEGNAYILLGWDNESTKFGVFGLCDFMCPQEDILMVKPEMPVTLFITRVVIINCTL